MEGLKFIRKTEKQRKGVWNSNVNHASFLRSKGGT